MTITAIRAGRLVRSVLGGSSSASGSGTPTVMAGQADGPLAVPAGITLHAIASLALPAGR